VASLTAESASDPIPAHAETLDYPWASAPCQFEPDGGASCQNPAPGKSWDKYDWYVDKNGDGHLTGNGCGEAGASSECFDSWGYEYRNCTSFVAWKLSTLGVDASKFQGLRNGGQWYDNSPSSARKSTPTAGMAAVRPTSQSDPFGHVAFVESVNNDGTITVAEYNHDAQGHGDHRTATAASMGFTEFVDFGVDPNAVQPGSGESTPSTNPYGPKNVTVVPNLLGGLSVFTASDAGLMGYKDQSYPGEDLNARPWGSITEHLIGQPEIVQYPNGALAVFGHGDTSAHHLYHAWQTGPGTAWSGDISPWNVSLRGEPSAVFNYTGGVSVFFPDSNGEMREIDQIGQGGDLGSAPVHNLGGNLQGKPAVMNINGALALFAHGADGQLEIDFQSVQGGSWSGWQNIGGQHIKGDPKAFLNRLGGMSVIAIGDGGDIVGIDQTYPGESMNKPFYSLAKPAGVDFTGTPGVIQTQYGEQMVFATSTSGILYHKAQVSSNSYNWTDFFLLGGNFIGGPTVARNSVGGVSVFGRNPDGTVITLDQPGYGASFSTTWIGIGKP
jgi:surface antigen